MRDARALVLLPIVAALAAIPVITGGTYYTFLGIIVFIYSIVAIGLNILSGYAGRFSPAMPRSWRWEPIRQRS